MLATVLSFVLAADPSARPALPPPAAVSAQATPEGRHYPLDGEAKSLLRAIQGSEAVIADLQEHKALFANPEDKPLAPTDRAELLRAFASLLDYEIALDGVKDRYRGSWYGQGDKAGQLRAYVVTYAAYLAQVRLGMTLLDLVDRKTSYERLLNEPNPDYGVGAGHLSRIKDHTLSATTAVKLRAGHDYLVSQGAALKDAKLLDDGSPFLELVRFDREKWPKTDALYWKRGFGLGASAKLGAFRDSLFGAVFPAQVGIASWLGDTRVRRNGRNLIHKEQLEALRPKLQPGDVIVERRNWYLSNVGLPGFWPHAELYTGTKEELAAYFDSDPEVRKAWPDGFTAALEKKFPAEWKEWTSPSTEGEARRVIEAVSEGVVFSAIEESMLADYIGVMRPRLTKVEKANSLWRAFSWRGRPYDFDFDFLTDATLVCSELVYKAYQAPRGAGMSLSVPLVKVAGRTTLPPNEIVRKFDVEFGTPNQQLDFVAFLDGRESLGKAVEGTVEDLRGSYKRPKWDVSQK